MRYENTFDLYPAANGTVLTTTLTDNGGTRAPALTGPSITTVDTSVKLTPDARSSIKIETAAGVTTAGAVVMGNLSNVSGSFDYLMSWDIDNTTTTSFMQVYDNATSSASMAYARRLSGGVIQLVDKAGTQITGTPTTPVLTAANGTIRFVGRIEKGTTTTDGKLSVTAVRMSDGVTLFAFSSTTVNTGTVDPKNMHIGKLTATGATGTGIRIHLQNGVFQDGLAGLADPIPVWTPGATKVIVETGASNMVGRATDDGGTDSYDPRVWVVPAHGANVGRPVRAREYLRHPDPTEAFGPSNTFVADYVANRLGTGERLLIVPAAYGGTGFTTPDSNGAAMTWLPSAPDDANNRFRRMVDQVNAVRTLVGVGLTIVAILHNAGSTDGSNNTAKETYRGYFLAFIDALRTELGATVPFLMMQSRPSLIAAETRHRIIDEVQRETVAVRPYTAYAFSPTGDEYKAADVVHFNAAGYRVIGHNLYAVLDDAEANVPGGTGPTQPFTAVYVGAALALGVYVNAARVWKP